MKEYGTLIAIVLVIFLVVAGGFFFSKELIKDVSQEPEEIIINERIVEPVITENE